MRKRHVALDSDYSGARMPSPAVLAHNNDGAMGDLEEQFVRCVQGTVILRRMAQHERSRVREGSVALDFSLTSDAGKTVTLSSLS